MRKLIFAINISLDGCCDHTKFGGSEGVLEYHTNLLRDIDLFVYGRKTYQLMVPYWPEAEKDPTSTKAEIEFAKAFNSINKVVFSRTLDSKDAGEKTRVVKTDLRDEVGKLKQAPGGNILTGGVSIPSQLIELDLVDQYLIVVHPNLIGDGRRLLEGISLKKDLALMDSHNLKSGVVILRYQKK